jgi:hypothetical protein
MIANLPTPEGVAKARSPSAHLFTRKAVATPSSVLPNAIAADVKSDPAVR